MRYSTRYGQVLFILLTLKSIIMKKIAKDYASLWMFLALLPTVALIRPILMGFNVDSFTTTSIMLLLLVIQLFSLFMIIRYRKEIL